MTDSESQLPQNPAKEPAPAGYATAREQAAFLPRMATGFLTVAGPDRLDFLQRQSSNDLNQLAPGRPVQTVLLNAKARILDVLTLLREEELLLAITLPGRVSETLRFLRSRIFFMDDVQLEDAGDEHVVIDLEGPAAPEVLADLGLGNPPAENRVQEHELGGATVRIIGTRGLAGPGFRLVAPAQARGELASLLRGAGAEPLSPEGYHILRVEAGRPEAGHELTDAHTPLEVGLRHLVSENKGCYTGQEVIARQLTYDKVTHQLAGLQLISEASAGDRVWARGRAAGEITSVAHSPQFGRIALGVLRRPHHEPGGQVKVGGDKESADAARVVALPFQD